MLEHDLKEALTFIEPTQRNFSTYSHRIYSLFIRACTEFEASCKMILIENNYEFKKDAKINICTYYDIHSFSKYKFINTYLVRLHMSDEIDLKPLAQWKKDEGPSWYKEYNAVKHSRILNFPKANLENLLNAIAGVFILLYARYGNDALNQYQETSSWQTDGEVFLYKENSLFKIKPVSEGG